MSPVAAQLIDIEEIISGIGGSEFQAAVRRVDSAADVQVVRLSTLAGSDDAAERLQAALAAKPREVAYLHASIILNPIALTALRKAGAEIDSVASLIIPSESAAVLFVDDL